MTARSAVAFGATLCALAVVCGAFGAHFLDSRLAVDRLELWSTAAQYLMYAGLGVVLSGAVARAGQLGRAPGGAALLVGGVVFWSTVTGLALGGPGFLGAVTPIGGLLLIVGFIQLGLGGSR